MPPVGLVDPFEVSRLVEDINYTDYEMSSPENMRQGAFQTFYAGFLDKRPFSITFRETELGLIKRYFRAWRNLIVDGQGLFKRKKGFGLGYAKPITMNYLNNAGDIRNTIVFSYAFPTSFNNWTASYNESNVQKMTVNFVCDYIDDVVQELVSIPEQFIHGKVVDTLSKLRGF